MLGRVALETAASGGIIGSRLSFKYFLCEVKIKHIYWFAYYNLDEASVRYRAKYALKHLNSEYNITYSIIYPGYSFKSIFKFVTVFFSALLFRKSNSLIVFQKIYTQGIYATALKLLLRARHSYTLYDIDDAEYLRRPDKTIHHFMENCSACSVGSRALLDYVKKINPQTFLLNSPVIDHGIIKQELEENFTIGWVGYYGAHKQSLLSLFFPAINRIGFPVTLRLLGAETESEVNEVQDYFKGKPNVLIDMPLNLDWQNELSIYSLIKTFDIGVSPLLDTEFNRCKSAFKLKQCLSCGIPMLGSSVGENRWFLLDGYNGYVCDTPDAYYSRIVELKADSDGRYNQLSLNAKQSFSSFSIDHFCLELIKHYAASGSAQAVPVEVCVQICA